MNPKTLNKIFKTSEVYNRAGKGTEKPQERCFQENPDAKLYMSYQPSTTNRYYIAFPTIKEFLKSYLTNVAFNEDSCFYEIIKEDCSPKMYMDIDCPRSEANPDEKTVLKKFIQALQMLTKKYLDHKLKTKDFKITKSSNASKISLHLVYDSPVRFSSIAQHKAFMNIPQVKEALSNTGVDFGVYTKNRAMRIYGSTKAGQGRYLEACTIKGETIDRSLGLTPNGRNRWKAIQPYMITDVSKASKYFQSITIEETPTKRNPSKRTTDKRQIIKQDDEHVQRALDLFGLTDEAKNFGVSPKSINTTEGFIEVALTRVASSHCKLCERVHDNDNTAYLFVCIDDNKVFQKCFKSSGKSIFIGNIKEDTEAEYTEVQMTEPETKQTVIERAITTSTKGKYEEFASKMAREFERVGAKVINYNQKRCSHETRLVDSKATIIGSKANQGSGKTYSSAERVVKHLNTPDKRVLITSFRISLTEQLKTEKYNAVDGLVSYRDNGVKLNNAISKMIVQPESFHRIQWTKQGREYLLDEFVIDEVSQVIKQLTSKTFRNQPNAKHSWKKFKHLVKGAKTLHLMDANLEPKHIKFFKDIRDKNDDIDVYWNHYRNFKDRSICLLNNELDIIRLAQSELKQNKRIYIACNGSTEKIRAVADYLKHSTEKEKKVLMITRETLHLKEVIEATKKPNEQWGKYDAVIVSPSIQSGVSYDKKNTFDTVYGMFRNHTSTSHDAGQMLNRIRHPTNSKMYVSVVMSNNNVGNTAESGIVEALRKNNEHTNTVNRELAQIIDYEIDDYGFNMYARNDFFRLYLKNETETNRNLQFFLWEFVKQHHYDGFKMEAFDALGSELLPEKDEKTHTAITKVVRRALKVIKDKHKTQDSIAIAEAINISNEEIEAIVNKLSKNNEVQENEILELKKANTLKIYGLKPDDLEYNEDVENAPWFKLYGEKKHKKVYMNQKLTFSKRTFSEVLRDIKAFEIKRAKNQLTDSFDPNTGEPLIEGDDMSLKGAIDLINTENRYARWKLLMSWLETLGFDSLKPTTTGIKRHDILKGITNIHSNIRKRPSDVIRILGKKKYKIEALNTMKQEADNFLEKMLKFVNGSFLSEYGITITRNKVNLKDGYVLNNKYLTEGNDIRFTLLPNDKSYIPKLKTEDVEDGYETEEGEDI
jgi:hypothetical protein